MRTPSTSDLIHAEVNKAYDKMAVLSDNADKFQEIYDVIFDFKEWLRQKLNNYVSVGEEQSIDSVKTFNEKPRLVGNKYFSTLDMLENIGQVYATYIDGNPALCFEVTRKEESSNSNLTNMVTYVDRAYLTFNEDTKVFHLDIPPTIGTDPASSVRVDYLRQELNALRETINEYTFDTTPTLNSTNPVTSDGIYRAIQAVLNRIPSWTFDTAPTEGSTNPVTSGGIYTFITNLMGNIETYTPTVASKTQKGIMQVGDYLVVDNGLVSVDLTAIREELGLSGNGDNDTYSTWFYKIGTIVGRGSGNYFSSEGQQVPVKKKVSGGSNDYLYPSVYTGDITVYPAAASGTVFSTQVGDTITCTNSTTGVTKKYKVLRYMYSISSAENSPTPSTGDGSPRFTAECIVFFKANDYTLTASDIEALNIYADNWSGSHPPIFTSQYSSYDTGAVS